MQSRSFRATGINFSWISDGPSNPIRSTAASVFSPSPRLEKDA